MLNECCTVIGLLISTTKKIIRTSRIIFQPRTAREIKVREKYLRVKHY
jgi:hypothetical protein